LECGRLERWPPSSGFLDIRNGDGRARGEAVDARAARRVDLHDFHQVGSLAGGGHQLQLTVPVDEHQAPRVGVQDFRALFDQRVKEVDHIEICRERVCDGNECCVDPCFARCSVHIP
jgi:hypothetical protein